ncbi:MAG TPA: guanylate kinase, partial [Ignavibacteriaceae bacterium]|nr:guanylate kinase [Ignavibacteriaceae bacterium]
SYPEANLIFILPPSFEELVNRLKNRKTETEEDLRKRIERARMELDLQTKFDFHIVNDNVEEAILHLTNLINKIINKE